MGEAVGAAWPELRAEHVHFDADAAALPRARGGHPHRQHPGAVAHHQGPMPLARAPDVDLGIDPTGGLVKTHHHHTQVRLSDLGLTVAWF